MTRRIYILLLILCGTMPMVSQTVDTALVEHKGVWSMSDAASRQNPAIHAAAYTTSYSQIALSLDWKRQTRAFIEEKGTGFLLPQASVDTYLRLSERTAVWGSAAYMTGKQYNIRWNSTTDYDLLQPYLLADTLGGDTQRERYTFSGGYGTRLGKWLLGGEMLFRAEHEYRDVDPRMRGIVNDLTLRFGMAADRWLDYRIGLAVEGNIYKQTNDVDFYRELGVIPEYQMTGLGTEYFRFSGDKRTLYYKGNHVRLLFDAQPLSGTGLYGHAELFGSRHRRVLASYNSMPLTTLYKSSALVEAGWQRDGKHRMKFYGTFFYRKNSGDEHIAGEAGTNTYPIIGRLTMYKNHFMDASLNAMYGQTGTTEWAVRAAVGYQSDSETYAFTRRKMAFHRLKSHISGDVLRHFTKRLAVSGGADVSYTACVDNQIDMPYDEMRPFFVDYITHKYTYGKADYTQITLRTRADYSLTRHYGLFGELQAGSMFCSEDGMEGSLRLTVGVRF